MTRPNIEHRRLHRRGGNHQHIHQHVHHHRTVILQPPAQQPRPLTPTMQSLTVHNNPTRINAPTTYKTYAPTVTATQTNNRPLVAAPSPVQSQEDDFGAFVCGLLSAVAIGLAIFGGGGGGGGGPKR